jgi:hypothetical protein
MPAKKKKVRKLRPYEKCQNFMMGYEKLCEEYGVEKLESICLVYNDLIAKGKAVRKLPVLFQFTDDAITGAQLRPLIEAYQRFEVRIRFLSMMNTRSGDDGLHMLAHALSPPLEVAGIAYHAQGCGPSGLRSFARAFVQSKFLSVLEFDFNPDIGDEGAAGLCHYGHCATLTKLSLRYCGIGDRGAEAIGKWLAEPGCTIKELLLAGNRIGPGGAIAFGCQLGDNHSLTRLDLSDNLFGYDVRALSAIHDGIRSCQTLVAVTILNRNQCPPGIDQKFIDLTNEKPLGECVLTPKMETFSFQNMAAFAIANKKKIARMQKEASRKGGAPPPPQEEGAAQPPGDQQPPEATSLSGRSPQSGRARIPHEPP